MSIGKVNESAKEKPTKKTSTEENKVENKKISLDPNEHVDDDDSVQAEFEDEATANSFSAEPTRENKEGETSAIPPDASIDDVKAGLDEYERSRSGKLEFKDLQKTAEWIVTLLDTGMSTLFKAIAKGGQTKDFSMPASNKKILVEQLALMLSKYQSKFKVEFLFLMGMVILYAPMAVESVQTRKKINRMAVARDSKTTKKITEQDIVSEKTSTNEETKTEVSEPSVENAPVIKKRGKGRLPRV